MVKNVTYYTILHINFAPGDRRVGCSYKAQVLQLLKKICLFCQLNVYFNTKTQETLIYSFKIWLSQ